MGGINLEQYEPEVEMEVLVQFQTSRNTTVEGSYFGTFTRPDQDELSELLDPDNEYKNIEILQKYLKKVRGIGTGAGSNNELPPDEQLARVMKMPECVNAGVLAFLKVFRPARYEEKTSKQRRSRG